MTGAGAGDAHGATQQSLVDAVRAGDVVHLQRAVALGANVDSFIDESSSQWEQDRRPLLVVAVKLGDIGVVRALLDAGASLRPRELACSSTGFSAVLVDVHVWAAPSRVEPASARCV